MTVQPADGLSPTAAFPDPSHDQWQSLVEGVLRKSGKEVSGSAAEEALSTTLEDGLTTRPLYTASDESPDTGFPGFAPFTRGSRAEGNAAGGWDVRQRHALADPARLNEALLGDLENGVTSLWLTVGGPAGVPVDGLARALEGVYLDLAPVALDAPADLDAAATELLRLYEERGVAESEARGTLGADPLGHEARTGVEADLAPAVRWA
ncbi:methylmalonyl-CoA mutase family protein, partial [Streptomyces globisporus]|uniref:methylmalonyl-CoA mutase family protein n=2 Tax=Streptomyces griseus group TaxID=629295 RepID=UPI00345FCD02